MQIQSAYIIYYMHCRDRVGCTLHTINITTVLCRPNITENQKIARAHVKVTEEWANTLKQQERPPTEDMPHL